MVRFDRVWLIKSNINLICIQRISSNTSNVQCLTSLDETSHFPPFQFFFLFFFLSFSMKSNLSSCVNLNIIRLNKAGFVYRCNREKLCIAIVSLVAYIELMCEYDKHNVENDKKR